MRCLHKGRLSCCQVRALYVSKRGKARWPERVSRITPLGCRWCKGPLYISDPCVHVSASSPAAMPPPRNASGKLTTKKRFRPFYWKMQHQYRSFSFSVFEGAEAIQVFLMYCVGRCICSTGSSHAVHWKVQHQVVELM